jgi:hypothetical protein
MTPSFLRRVAAPSLHASFIDLIDLWTVKMHLSNGRPFCAKRDIYNVALEAIWGTLFGVDGTATITRENISLLCTQRVTTQLTTHDDAMVFEQAAIPLAFEAIFRLTECIDYLLKSPFPGVIGWLMRNMVPSVRKWTMLKDRTINNEISKAEQRMERDSTGRHDSLNAVDHMLRRERMAAERQSRLPEYQSRIMIAEVSLPKTSLYVLH